MRCPRCRAEDLDPTRHDSAGMITCQCGHRAYAGYVAEADARAGRSAWLAERIAAGDGAPVPELRAQYAVWDPPSSTRAGTVPVRAGTAQSLPRTHDTPSAQTILLALGALLLVIAGAVFAAVVWDRLGAAGQVVLMLAATAGIGTLAVRLRARLPGTAEALAAVAAGLAAVDLFAAPLLGLLPRNWISDPTLYPAMAFALLGMVLVLLNNRFSLRAWSWLGWTAVQVSSWFVVMVAAGATDDLDSGAWFSAALVAPTLTSIAMLAGSQHSVRWPDQRRSLQVLGALGLAISTVATAAAALSSSALPGALVTTATATVALGTWSALDHGRTRLVELGASALLGVSIALMLALPADPQPVWLAAAVSLAGLTVGFTLWVLRDDQVTAIVGSCSVWIPWAAVRIASEPEPLASDLVTRQMSLLAATVAVIAFAVAWRLPATGWVGALLGMLAMVLAQRTWQDPIEAYSLPFATLLLLAGLLWRRRGPTPSLLWLGPSVAMALIPSAVATWAAPWAWDVSNLDSSWHLARLGATLCVCVIAVVTGARLNLGGLLVPAATALIIAAGAQVWSGLSNLPRWFGLAIAGTLLVLAGARIEWLRRESRRAAGWLEGLR